MSFVVHEMVLSGSCEFTEASVRSRRDQAPTVFIGSPCAPHASSYFVDQERRCLQICVRRETSSLTCCQAMLDQEHGALTHLRSLVLSNTGCWCYVGTGCLFESLPEQQVLQKSRRNTLQELFLNVCK